MRSIRRLSVLALGLLALGSAACDRAGTPTAPAPGAARPGLIGDVGGYTLVAAGTRQGTASVKVVLGAGGGMLSVNGHTLTVPAGALAEPTRFTMTTVSGSSIRVALTAADAKTGAPVTEFPTPLRLSLSYANAQVSNPSKLKVAWIVNGEIVAVQRSDVDRLHRTVSSSLYHFSDWAVCN